MLHYTSNSLLSAQWQMASVTAVACMATRLSVFVLACVGQLSGLEHLPVRFVFALAIRIRIVNALPYICVRHHGIGNLLRTLLVVTS